MRCGEGERESPVARQDDDCLYTLRREILVLSYEKEGAEVRREGEEREGKKLY